MVSPSARTSSAPASRAISVTASSVTFSPSKMIWPRFLNLCSTEPEGSILAFCRSNSLRSSDAVRLRLSVAISITMATPPGP